MIAFRSPRFDMKPATGAWRPRRDAERYRCPLERRAIGPAAIREPGPHQDLQRRGQERRTSHPVSGGAPPASLAGVRRPAVLLANGIGDGVIALPALRALSALFPAPMMLLCLKEPARCSPNSTRLSSPNLDCGGRNGVRWFDVSAVAAVLRGADLFVSLNPWHSPAVDELLERLRPCQTFGYFAGLRRVDTH